MTKALAQKSKVPTVYIWKTLEMWVSGIVGCPNPKYHVNKMSEPDHPDLVKKEPLLQIDFSNVVLKDNFPADLQCLAIMT